MNIKIITVSATLITIIIVMAGRLVRWLVDGQQARSGNFPQSGNACFNHKRSFAILVQ